MICHSKVALGPMNLKFCFFEPFIKYHTLIFVQHYCRHAGNKVNSWTLGYKKTHVMLATTPSL
jgi:hypothetical protein